MEEFLKTNPSPYHTDKTQSKMASGFVVDENKIVLEKYTASYLPKANESINSTITINNHPMCSVSSETKSSVTGESHNTKPRKSLNKSRRNSMSLIISSIKREPQQPEEKNPEEQTAEKIILPTQKNAGNNGSSSFFTHSNYTPDFIAHRNITVIAPDNATQSQPSPDSTAQQSQNESNQDIKTAEPTKIAIIKNNS